MSSGQWEARKRWLAPPPVWTPAASASSTPPFALGGSSDEAPIHADWLAHHVLTVQAFHGCLGLFVGLILHQGITLEVTRSAIEVEMKVLDLSELCKLVVDVLLSGLLVNPSHEQNPTLHRSLRARFISILFHCVIVFFDSGPSSFL